MQRVVTRQKGMSTGHVTVIGITGFERDFSIFTPFIGPGSAKSVTDTRFFKRPFTSYGHLAPFEAGTDVDLSHAVS